jgi:hypothetical protein
VVVHRFFDFISKISNFSKKIFFDFIILLLKLNFFNKLVILLFGVREEINSKITPLYFRCSFDCFKNFNMNSSPFFPPVVAKLLSLSSLFSLGR